MGTIKTVVVVKPVQSNPVTLDTEGAIENVHIDEVSIISRLNLEKMYGLSYPMDKANCL